MNNVFFNFSLHNKFWKIIANFPGKTKREVLGICQDKKLLTDKEIFRISQTRHLCLACEYAITVSQSKDMCLSCPFKIRQIKIPDMSDCFNGMFLLWVKLTDKIRNQINQEEDIHRCIELANDIANWPTKKGVLYEKEN